uniref:SPK domain-containing protein n=2 Tax=Caenorhabditis japonica TaxID=281687 RepID=A0A8R1DSF9_CAEJA
MFSFRRSMIPALDASTFDMQTKTLIHYALEIPCTEEFLSDLREEENVEVNVNEANIITGYRKIRKNGIVEDDGWEEIWGENAIGVSVSGNESLDFSMENGGSGTEGTNSLYDEDDRNIQSS